MNNKTLIYLKSKKQLILYIVFGVATTIVNWSIYGFLVKNLQLNMNFANLGAFFVSVLFAFCVNKIWVFDSKSWQFKIVIKEGSAFIGMRLFTGLFELVSLPILVNVGINETIFGIDGFVAKILISFVVIIVNYIISKVFVFKE